MPLPEPVLPPVLPEVDPPGVSPEVPVPSVPDALAEPPEVDPSSLVAPESTTIAGVV